MTKQLGSTRNGLRTKKLTVCRLEGYLMKPKSEFKSNSYNILSFIYDDYEKAQNVSSSTPHTKAELEKAFARLSSQKEEILSSLNDHSINWGKFNYDDKLQIMFS